MLIKRLIDNKILNVDYITWTKSEFQKDGEKELLQMTETDWEQRASDPYLYYKEENIIIKAENSNDYILLETTEIGKKNLQTDGFKFL